MVAVASAKGGVGKSTVSVNLALGAARTGAQVGLLDADIYGPSAPLMLGIDEQPELTDGNRLLPVFRHGLAVMSMGLIADEDTPVVWRGPLLAQAVQQFLRQVEWGVLDCLFLDLPPGTGDIPLTLSQAVALSGAVIVTTPQDVALDDVERGIAMFDKVEVEVLGLIENMSYYDCPSCSKRHRLFGEGGGRALAEDLDIPFLGEIPISESIRSGGDRGRPVAAGGDGEGCREKGIFDSLAARVLASLEDLPAT
ncbi:MAG: Mrp/NBP35 family ATP-binding protein [Gemmatimonadetes bacterium]|nr:Mrp/NBP35 family ATP-binding protein [Gemmatimonadota bacterium]